METERKSYRVILSVLTDKEFMVDACHTPEEAIEVAESLLEDGEGTIVTQQVEMADAEELEYT